MSDLSVVHGEIMEELPFFAPASTDMIDGLISEYRRDRAALVHVADFMHNNSAGVLHYFIEGNTPDQRLSLPKTVSSLFQLDNAIGQLNADYWNRALRLTDVLDIMPQNRRNEWFEQIRNPMGKKAKKLSVFEIERGAIQKEWELEPLPDFEEETVRATIGELLMMRSKFFAERVDGIFRALSGTHVTNEPQGFGKRMIMAGVIGSFGCVDHCKSGHINDLRAVIAKFMGRDEPKYGVTDAVIQAARRNAGQWNSVDAGALRIRVYNGVGTAHLEVHPDMAWRLNAILASLYPAAIPPKFRQKPPRKSKEFVMMGKPLPFAVVSALAAMKEAHEPIPDDFQKRTRRIPNTLQFSYGSGDDKAVIAEAEQVLESIGGVKLISRGSWTHWQFDYNPEAVIDEIVCSGCVPHQKSHQFYPTPENLARIAVELAGIEDGHDCLEPSAGTGGLADLMPKDRTMCVEISRLHCKVLEAKGFMVRGSDFMTIPADCQFARIVMNPPYSEGRWQSHLQHAAKMLAVGGRLVAILPASAKGKDDLLPGLTCSWSETYDNQFAGASVSVVILKADKAGA